MPAGSRQFVCRPGRHSSYHIPSIFCITRLTHVIPAQQQAPMKIGFPPVFISFTTLVFSPIAPIAMTMKNLLSVFRGLKIPAGTPKYTATVVITEAATQ